MSKRSSPVAKRKSRLEGLEDEDVRRLANIMQNFPLIWDLSHSQHSNSFAIRDAWKKIAEKLGISIEQCKAAWSYLRESHRYHMKTASKRVKIEDDETPNSENAKLDWEYSEELSFLPRSTRSRPATKLPPEETSQASVSPSAFLVEDDIPISSKDHNSSEPCSRRSSINLSIPDICDLFDRMQNLIQQRDNLLKKEDSPNSKALIAFDWLLTKLPNTEREKACLEITSFLLQKVEENKGVV